MTPGIHRVQSSEQRCLRALSRKVAERMKKTLVSLMALTVYLMALPARSAQIYECVAIGGGEFYSTGRCSEHKAVGRIIHQVPDGLPFDQQVDIINKRKGAEQKQEDTFSKLQECSSFADELAALNKKYAQGNYVEVNEVNRDQARHRELKSRQASRGCFSK